MQLFVDDRRTADGATLADGKVVVGGRGTAPSSQDSLEALVNRLGEALNL